MQEEILKAVATLKKGGSILYPTDTIWGLGCDATSKKAVKRLHNIKQRGDKKSFIILLEDKVRLSEYLSSVPEVAEALLDSIDTPLTVVYPKAKGIAKNVISSDGSVAIRIPKDTFVIELLKSFGKPIVSTSANFSGDTPPMTFRDISQELIDSVDFAVNFNRDRLDITKPSTIIRIKENGDYEVLRK